MRKILFGLLFLTLFTNATIIDECKVDLYYATDIILPEDEENAEEVWKVQSRELLKKYPQLKERIGERKVAYNISNGVISDYLVKAKEDSNVKIGWESFKIFASIYLKSATSIFINAVDNASLMINNGTIQRQIESYNRSIEVGHGVIVVAHSTGNFLTEEVFNQFKEKGEEWKQDYFHTIAVASTQSSIINGGNGVTFDNDIVYLEDALQANKNVKISNPNRHDWGYKNSLNEHVIHEDFKSSEYHKFEYYMGYPVMETTRITENFNTVESKIRQTNVAKDMISLWLKDEIMGHKDRDSQWVIDEETNKNSKDYRITVKHKFDSTNSVMSELEVYPFNTDKNKKLYSVGLKYVKASCRGKNITEVDEYWMIDNLEEEKIGTEEQSNAFKYDKVLFALFPRYIQPNFGWVYPLGVVRLVIFGFKDNQRTTIMMKNISFSKSNSFVDMAWSLGSIYERVYSRFNDKGYIFYEVDNTKELEKQLSYSWNLEFPYYAGASGLGAGNTPAGTAHISVIMNQKIIDTILDN